MLPTWVADFGLHGVETGHAGPESATDRRPDPGPEILCGLRAELVLERTRRNQTDARNSRSALAGEISHERSCFKYAGVSAGIPLQNRIANGECESLQGVVGRCGL